MNFTKSAKTAQWFILFASFFSALFNPIHSAAEENCELEISAISACIMDYETGKILWKKNKDDSLPPASTTKILTALLLIENTNPTDIITAPEDVNKIGEASIFLLPGEKISSENLLKAIIISSANDAAYTAAIHIAKSEEAFVRMMNLRAKRMGCRNTNFLNPHGLHHPNHITTAHDLAVITKEALKNPTLADVVKMRTARITRENPKGKTLLISRNQSLKDDSTADGVKTGFTNAAGKCLVGSATRDGRRMITVILNSKDRNDDNKKMLDWAFSSYKSHLIYAANTPISSLRINEGEQEKLLVGTNTDINIVSKLTKKDSYSYQIETSEPLTAPIKKGSIVGRIHFTDLTGYRQTYPLIALNDIHRISRTILVSTHHGTEARLLSLLCIISTTAFTTRRRSIKSGTTI